MQHSWLQKAQEILNLDVGFKDGAEDTVEHFRAFNHCLLVN